MVHFHGVTFSNDLLYHISAATNAALRANMTCACRLTAPVLLVHSLVGSLLAETTGGPPAWNDKGSVYLAGAQAVSETPPAPQPTAPSADVATTAAVSKPVVEETAAPSQQPTPAASANSPTSNRYLAPPGARFADNPAARSHDSHDQAGSAARRFAEFGLPTRSLYTVVSALAIVIGAFLLFTWALKRSNRRAAGRDALPADVVSVLGRVPLAARQFAELLRVGNKLVLVALTPTGPITLTEVTDPAEVDRLMGLCQQSNPFSTTKAFEQVFQQMSTDPAPTGFLGNEGLMPSLASPVAAYRANRGGPARV